MLVVFQMFVCFLLKKAEEEARESFPNATVATLKAKLDKVLAAGKVPLLVCKNAALHEAAVDALKVLDGRGLDAAAWAIDRKAFDSKVAEEKAAYLKQAQEDYDEAVKQWHVDTEARKERRREIDLEGGDEYASSDEEEDVSTPKPYPG